VLRAAIGQVGDGLGPPIDRVSAWRLAQWLQQQPVESQLVWAPECVDADRRD